MNKAEIFRVASAGSVDDGKSTLLARILLDTGSLKLDKESAQIDSTNLGDLLDGLESEKEQGITIDVAHRFFDFGVRRYHLTDSPGHEQYTRNMATASAGSDALLMVLDVRSGIKPQTKLHLNIAIRLGIQHIIFAVNKMDLVQFKKDDFERIRGQLVEYVEQYQGVTVYILPVSGLLGDNVTRKSSKMPWYSGDTILDILNTIEKKADTNTPAYIRVENIQRKPGGGRRYQGSLLAHCLSVGDDVFINEFKNRISKVIVDNHEKESAFAPASVSLELEEDQDIGIGDVISREQLTGESNFEGEVVWLSTDPGIKGRPLLFISGSQQIRCSLTRIYSIEEHKQGEITRIDANQLARVKVSLTKPTVIKPFHENQKLGRFILVDPQKGSTLAVGRVNFALRKSQNIREHSFNSRPEDRAKVLGQAGAVFWLTGLSGSGKSTVADAVSSILLSKSIPHTILDGDSLRLGINRDLGFSEEDRAENIRRTAEIAKILAEAGLIVLVALVSPLEADRRMAKEIVGAHRFFEIFMDTPLEVCESRDPKGLYAKARAGQIPNFTGVNSKYENPKNPDLYLESNSSVSQNTQLLVNLIQNTLQTKA